jgi:hypothetical protein
MEVSRQKLLLNISKSAKKSLLNFTSFKSNCQSISYWQKKWLITEPLKNY